MSGGTQGQVLRLHVLAFVMGLLALAPLAASGQGPATEKVPRFASLRADEVNLRVGPGENYPIEWVLKRKDMPVEILEEFQNWRKVRDWQGDKGWVLDRMITGKRDVVIAGAVRAFYRQPDRAAAVVARAEPGVVARLIEFQGAWCHVEAGGFKGWVQRSEVWGVYPDETLQ